MRAAGRWWWLYPGSLLWNVTTVQAATSRASSISSLYSVEGWEYSSRGHWLEGGQQKPQQLSNFSCFFCSDTFLALFVTSQEPEGGRGGTWHLADRLLCQYRCMQHSQISGSHLFADIGWQYVLCPTLFHWTHKFCKLNIYIWSILFDQFWEIQLAIWTNTHWRTDWQWGIGTHYCPVCYAWVAIEPAWTRESCATAAAPVLLLLLLLVSLPLCSSEIFLKLLSPPPQPVTTMLKLPPRAPVWWSTA